MNELPSILLAEDEETDVLLLRRAFREAQLLHPLHVVSDGQEAIEFLSQRCRPPYDLLPALTILDLKMPRRNGMDVLQWKRDQPVICGLPAIVFSSSSHRADIEQAYALGANGYFVKPPSIAERADFARLIKQWLRFNVPPLASTEGYQSAHAAYLKRSSSRPPEP